MKTKSVRLHELNKERQAKSKIIAVMNNKGGCGKTTTALALGMYLARTGNNVLFWDNDPQSNLTQRLALADDIQKSDRLHKLFKNPESPITAVKIVKYPYLQRISKTINGVGKIGLMPGSHYAENAADSLARDFQMGSIYEDEIGFASIHHFFKNHLDSYRKYYDYIIIDTAPALEGNILNKLAIRATDEVIYPIDGLEAGLGVRQILNWMEVQTKDSETHPNALFTMVKYQIDTKNIADNNGMTKYHRNSVYRVFKDAFQDFVCDNGVREKRKLRASLAGFGGRTDYTGLCEEITVHMHSDRENIFDFIKQTDAVQEVETGLALIEAKVRKRRPKFFIPKYIPGPVDPVKLEDAKSSGMAE